MLKVIATMKGKRVEFHKFRYPAHLTRMSQLSRSHVEELYSEVDRRRNSHGYEEFLRWCAENNTAIKSLLFKTFYAARQKQEQAKQILFHNLRSISEHYTVALGLLGGCVSFLNKSHRDCKVTIQLTRTFLVEIAIYDSIFAAAYTRELATIEFLQWVERNPRSEPPTAEDDKAFTLKAEWAKGETADEYVNEAKLRVEREDLSCEHLNLIHEEKKRLSQPNHDLEFDYDRSSIIQEHIAQDMHLDQHQPLSLEGIKDTLKKWDAAGRHLAWHPLAIRRRQEFDRLSSVIEQSLAANPVEDSDFAEILWTEGERYRRIQEW